jgi:hypothetical protein
VTKDEFLGLAFFNNCPVVLKNTKVITRKPLNKYIIAVNLKPAVIVAKVRVWIVTAVSAVGRLFLVVH